MASEYKRFTVQVNAEGKAILERAIQLRDLLDGAVSVTPQSRGEALVEIVSAWCEEESARVRDQSSFRGVKS